MTNKVLLKWQHDMGADEALDDAPRNYFTAPREVPVEVIPQPATVAAPVARLQASPSLAAGTARELADKATTLEELEAAVRAFDGCTLKRTASKTVFACGNPNAKIMLIGEAPGEYEDQQGIPFCGPSGMLLDKMFVAIQKSRAEDIYICNSVFWRPPGNRQPNADEAAICLPFVQKHIALIAPKLLVLAGGIAASALLGRSESLSKLRGKFHQHENPYTTSPIPCIVTFNPQYLLQQPNQKRQAWQDMLTIQQFMKQA
jgi:uracil-DNA glycosylase family 4